MVVTNRDGLPDKLFDDPGTDALYYRPNQSGPSGGTRFGNKIAISGLNVFQKDKSTGYTAGLEAVAVTALIDGANICKTTTTTTIYFTEGKCAQLPHTVKGGQAYFQHNHTA